MVDHHRTELGELAAKLSGSKPGSAAYLGCYKRAFRRIDDALDEETRVIYRAEAKKWTEEGPPPEQQKMYVCTILLSDDKRQTSMLPRMFAKHGLGTLQEFSELMYQQYGVRVAVLAGYVDQLEEPAIVLYV